ncbi:hypothetical protein O181_108661 [Austropuccinia psidii MF-1]|uniref:Uncharacterized protein n=1 Tax=Austropuccinia psidii MF-1 TaxID=1389203 RepID=A0A9Q3JVQ8_9BASI|nr:hypothetical protein [Austropuccinia psidii MF-1]
MLTVTLFLVTVIMNPRAQSYGYGYSDLINAFCTEELEKLLFGYSSHPSNCTAFWDWVNAPSSTPPSPPALVTISTVSSPSSSLEEIPEASMAFYAFFEGEYDSRLFVPNPFDYFLGNEASNLFSLTFNDGYTKPFHPYNLRPCDCNGFVVKPSR